MGSLRFRRSVSIIPGVKLNFGKKGVSISSGVPGFRKTYNFNTGKTTTSVGIPGTGIYYVDTSGPSKKKEEKKNGGFFSSLFGENQGSSPSVSTNTSSYESTTQRGSRTETPAPVYPTYQEQSPTNVSSNTVDRTSNPQKAKPSKKVSDQKAEEVPTIIEEPVAVPSIAPVIVEDVVAEPATKEITYDTIKTIFENCDMAVDWIDVISNRMPTSDDFVSETWEYLHKKAVDVFDGDIDTYLEIISTVNPYDDLLDYAENFEFGTDDATCMEVEFSVIDDNTKNLSKSAFEDYYSAIAIRVARDTFALLPVEKTVVHINYNSNELLVANFDRDKFHKLDLVGEDPSDIIKELATKPM